MPRYFFKRTPDGPQKYSPGASVVPANMLPIITKLYVRVFISQHLPQLAPSANAFVILPTVLTPPSAITGTPRVRAYALT
jgi:hypothetical protein